MINPREALLADLRASGLDNAVAVGRAKAAIMLEFSEHPDSMAAEIARLRATIQTLFAVAGYWKAQAARQPDTP